MVERHMPQETIPEFGEFQDVQVVQSATIAELGKVVREAAALGQAVFPLGGRTMLGLGLPPSKPGIGVELRSLDQVIDYPAHDMTITVQAGITVAKLQAILAAENQQLPVDVPLPEQATLGGAIAVNASGPRRYGYGTLRDYVIGISFINDEGQEVKAGGRVVKNVAGYDLMKLHTGSLGTLGIITQVTLKVKPVPEERALLVGSQCDGARLGAVLEGLCQTQTRPAVMDFGWNPGVKADGQPKSTRAGFAVSVGFEGSREAVVWQLERIQQEMAVHELDFTITPADRVDEQLARTANQPEAPFRFRASLPPSQVAL